MFGFLGNHLGQSAFVALATVVLLFRFRRYKAVGAAAIGAVSSAATIGVAVIVTLFALVALGYWEPPVGEIIGDALGAGQALYDLVGEVLIDQTLGRLEQFT